MLDIFDMKKPSQINKFAKSADAFIQFRAGKPMDELIIFRLSILNN